MTPASTNRLTVVFIMIASLLLAGCQISTAPQDVGHFSSNRTAVKDNADYNGTFFLYHDDDDSTTGPALATAHLKKGDIYGFEFDAQQVPYAIAGNQRTQLTPGRYRWEMTPDAGQIDWDKTNAVVVTVVLITVAIAATVVIIIVTKNAV
jgi:hypothetical protein